ncbi:hypothetical protein [Phycisphaera mikurensis]|uniref:Hypothetical membrane protein n=1 Tax=Phycisphaera mikurensis (strain NBRC 102666 / KCTC 22515 / FYK2301M01) TaxID=1142394 RepID=I0IC03_PHYMF|nr:hypothetical protein [Phycisphaera mikurensis]MBB6441985.1 hypothetical protein [Phycisphaera mikurensis]BAM02791.1 hypothetical membrane protein [Phycisphaera mikurensis NBRC 102666]
MPPPEAAASGPRDAAAPTWEQRLVRRANTLYADSIAGLPFLRMAFALLFVLASLPSGRWVAAFESFPAQPPPGLPWLMVAAFGGSPPAWLYGVLNPVLGVLAFLLFVGKWTRTASVGLALGFLLMQGGLFTTGKIGHNITLVIMPLVMAYAGWGDRLSLDAQARARARARDGAGGRPRVSPARAGYLLTLWAWIVGCSLFTSALPKLRGGWLDTEKQAVLYHTLRNFHLTGRDTPTTRLTIELPMPWWVWEAQDWATVLAEGAPAFLVFLPLLFRVNLVVLVLFHTAVFFTMDIFFVQSFLAYAAFLPWRRMGALPGVRRARHAVGAAFARPRPAVLAVLLAVFLGSAVWGLDPLQQRLPPAVDLRWAACALFCAVVVGGIGAWHAHRWAGARRGPRP